MRHSVQTILYHTVYAVAHVLDFASIRRSYRKKPKEIAVYSVTASHNLAVDITRIMKVRTPSDDQRSDDSG